MVSSGPPGGMPSLAHWNSNDKRTDRTRTVVFFSLLIIRRKELILNYPLYTITDNLVRIKRWHLGDTQVVKNTSKEQEDDVMRRDKFPPLSAEQSFNHGIGHSALRLDFFPVPKLALSGILQFLLQLFVVLA